MKISTKDVISGAILLGIAIVGLWLNMDHNLGSARRMGPGYMPAMTFYIQGGIGVIVIVMGLFNGPDPLERWSGLDIATPILGIAIGSAAFLAFNQIPLLRTNMYAVGLGVLIGCLVWAISPAWKPLALVLAAMALFALLLEKGGFMLALTVSIVMSAFSDETHRPKGVLGMTIFLLALCYAVFIYYLDIRVNVWPQFS